MPYFRLQQPLVCFLHNFFFLSLFFFMSDFKGLMTYIYIYNHLTIIFGL